MSGARRTRRPPSADPTPWPPPIWPPGTPPDVRATRILDSLDRLEVHRRACRTCATFDAPGSRGEACYGATLLLVALTRLWAEHYRHLDRAEQLPLLAQPTPPALRPADY